MTIVSDSDLGEAIQRLPGTFSGTSAIGAR
jgi:hypothetical protein